MSLGSWLGAFGGGAVLLVSSLSRAQCTMDNDCKGDRVCESGQCIAPAAALPPAPPAPAGDGPAAAAANPVVAAPAPAPLAAAPQPAEPLEAPAPKMVRHSKGMMVGGIIMTSLTPVALIVAAGASLSASLCHVDRYDYDTGNTYRDNCNNDGLIYGALVTAAVLVGVGVPLIVIGAKKEPAGMQAKAIVAPWATPTAAGLGLRVNL